MKATLLRLQHISGAEPYHYNAQLLIGMNQNSVCPLEN